MSWFKKLWSKFKSDELDVDPFENTNVDNPINHPNERKTTKEIEAKVAYQYPKGQFRFPLIPDNQELNRINRSNDSKPDKKEYRKSNINREAKKTHVETRQPLIKNVVLDQSKPKQVQKQEKKVHRPFRPTEVPSPIYGFSRPQPLQPVENAPVVEYEITSLREDQTSTFMEQVEKTPDANPPLLVNQIEESPSDIFLDKVENVSNEYDKVMVTEKVEPFLETEEEWIEQSIDDKVGSLDLQEEKVNQCQEEVSESLERLIEESAVENAEHPEVQEIHTNNEMEVEPTATRSHIPFNVIMLKQDKQKWEARNFQQRKMDNQIPPDFNQKKQDLTLTASMEVPKEKEVVQMENTQLENKESTDTQTEKLLTLETTKAEEQENKKQQETQRSISYDYYEFPSASLLNPPISKGINHEWLDEQSALLDETLRNFNVGAKVVNVTQGPAVTRFEVQPEAGVKVNKITNLTDDIKLSLAAKDIRMEAPIPGKHAIGIEVPNQTSKPVCLSEIIMSKPFQEHTSPLTVALGLDIGGNPIVTDLKKMPHGLIAGSTGSGKSVCINSIIVSLLYKASPDELKLLLIDPKMVELAPYNRIPHLVSPVITDVKAATAALKWTVEEMERRYQLFAHMGVRDISRFNELAMKNNHYSDKLPYIVVIIDELADLMMMAPTDVEEAICRIAQKARACGIHLLIATQRPSVDVITGLIKANVPTRIAFSVSSQVDSRTIIDMSGAEKLLGKGDMLFLENGSSKPVRLQGTFVTDEEIDQVVDFVRMQQEPMYLFEQEELLKKAQAFEEEDELFYEACEYLVEQGSASTSSLQRRFKIGYNRAARLVEMLEAQGVISEARGSKPRDVLITESDLESLHLSSTIQ